MTHAILSNIAATITFIGMLSAAPLAVSQDARVAFSRPSGQNCDLEAPPNASGEEGGHGVLLQVWPRIKDMEARYTGCQAIFVTTAEQPTRLGWLVEVVGGEPRRLWSPQPDMLEKSSCIYEHGMLVQGEQKTCPEQSELLMPSTPAGCFSRRDAITQCDHDDDM
jgi:hypothetical protein